MACTTCRPGGGIKPEVLVALTAALAAYGYPADNYRIARVVKSDNPWRKAGIIELMLGRELNRNYL
ncbi:MAG: hypothetical protein K6T80_00850 [Firmicutes bacterium]|nr:hypothetical protein [Bacillota bacterium]